MVSYLVGICLFVGFWLFGWFVGFCLVGWLVFGWLVSWLVGWLVR